MSKPATTSSWKSVFARHETVLLVVLILEVFLFKALGPEFFSSDNLANILRHSFEVGLLALVMTPVILTGGIDLSVGSLMGLCAVIFGMLWQDCGLSIWLAALVAVGVGALGGGFNALLITRLGLPPLIVTLGTFSLFRGLAEALTGGTRAFTGFPEGFLQVGDGVFLGMPTQVWLMAVFAVAAWLLVHRTTFGRSFRALGFSPEGARYAGIPVARRTALAYTLAGAVAGVATIVFVSRFGQAKADAGSGYELAAITAVVLGGTSIFGGVGSIHGTLLGVATVAVLSNGLKFVDAVQNPTELASLLTGLLLLAALASGALVKTLAGRRARTPSSPQSQPSSSS